MTSDPAAALDVIARIDEDNCDRPWSHPARWARTSSPFIVEEKAQIIRKSGVLEYYPAALTTSDVGGPDALQDYAAIKRAAASDKAPPDGVGAALRVGNR